MSFVKTDKSILYSSELTSDEKVALIAMQDRLSLSMTKGDTFKQGNDYFIIYAQEVMAKVINKSVHTVIRLYKSLEQKGMITRQKRFNASDLIFLPVHSKIEDRGVPKLKPSKNNNNKNKEYTVNTADDPQINPVDIWKQAVTGKIGLSEQTADLILQHSHNDLKRAYQLVRVITNARNSVVNENGLGHSKMTDFKKNVSLAKRLPLKLKYVFNYLPTAIEEQGRYLTKSFKQYFLEEFGVQRDVYVDDSRNQLKSEKSFTDIPDWMNEKYDPEKNKLDPKKKAELDRKMDLLKAIPPKPIERPKIMTVY